MLKFLKFLNFLAKIPEFCKIPKILTELRSEKFEWFDPSPIEPLNSGGHPRRRRRPGRGCRAARMAFAGRRSSAARKSRPRRPGAPWRSPPLSPARRPGLQIRIFFSSFSSFFRKDYSRARKATKIEKNKQC